MPVLAKIATGKYVRLQEIPVEEMERILADRKRSSVESWPVFVDSLGRLWPQPAQGITLMNEP